MINYQYYRKNIRSYLREPKKKAYTMLGLTLLSLVTFGSFAIRPSLVTIFRLNKQVEETKKANEQLAKKIQSLYQVQDQYKKAKKDLYLFDLSLPTKKDVPQLLEKLTLLSGKAHVTIKSIRFGKLQSDPRSKELQILPLDINLTGNFIEVSEFLKLLENSLRQMDIKSIDFVSRSSREGVAVEVHLRLNTYFLFIEN